MTKAEIEEIVLDIIKKQEKRKKRLKKRHGRLPSEDNHKERKENEYIIVCYEENFKSIYHDHDPDRELH